MLDSQPDSFLSARDRLEMVWSCLSATKAFLQNRFSNPIGEHPRYLCLSSLEYMYAFVTGLKLITLQMPGWDGQRARQELSFDELIDRKIHDMHKLAERRRKKTPAGGTPTMNDPFERMCKMIVHVKSTLLAELDSVAPLRATPAEQQHQQPISPFSPDIMQDIAQGLDAAPWPDLYNDIGWDSTLRAPPCMDFWASTA